MKAIKNIFSNFFNKKEVEKKVEEISPVVCSSFKEEMNKKIIPNVRVMLEKEQKHLEFLKSQEQTEEVKGYIVNSEYHVKHFSQKIQEYIRYANNLQ